MLAEVVEWPVEQRRDGLGNENGSSERLGQRLNPARLVHGASDHGKIEPLGGADIAEENLARMERDPGS